MSENQSKWHWGEGIKYALEAIKILFLLNGASAISVLTFVGNTKNYSCLLVFSLVFFALGAATGVPTMMCAYFTQLFYGNAEQSGAGTQAASEAYRTAIKFHGATYWCAGFGILLFLLGVGFSAWGLLSLAPSVLPT